jgi:hypothetical protein
MPYTVDFSTVSTTGLESSPVAAALAGLRANEARYFKNKYDHVFTVEPASDATANSALLNTAWMSSGLMMPMVEVRTMSPTTTATCPRYGRNSGVTRRAVFRPPCGGGSALAAAAGAASGPRVVIRPLSHPRG